jgi:hypothetical protein
MNATVIRAFAADVVAIVAFVTLGRRNHHDAVDASGVVGTAAPFLMALAAGWLVLRLWRHPTSTEWALALWAITLTVGMLARKVIWGDGTATAFVIVAGVATFVLLVGWRSVWTWRTARQAARQAEAKP